jgi:hypothetical protein
MSQGYPPQNFSLAKYRDALIQIEIAEDRKVSWDEEWQPGLGVYLGPKHYRQAVCNLEKIYLQTLRGNEERFGKLITFLNRDGKSLRKQFASKCTVNLGFLDKECEAFTTPEEVQRENIQKMVSFLSLWAYVCRKNARKQGVLENFLADIEMRLSMLNMLSNRKSMLSYLLYVGEDVFAFYLLLWEFVFTCDIDIRGKGHA